jgi:surfactin synthase thioesterase subunit
MDEQPFEEMEPLIQTLAQVLLPYLDKPFAFYGHSMGSLISFELARQLRRQSGLIPVHLFAAAYYAPNLPNPFQSLCTWTDSMLIQEFPRLLDVHQKILEDADFIQALLPTFKADLQILSSYIYREEDPLDCPISAFCGQQDIEVKSEHLLAWQDHTRSKFKLERFPGKHLFLLTDQQMILSTIAQELKQSIVI